MEFTGGEFLHLALVPNPRYERANIVMNSQDDTETIFLNGLKTIIENALDRELTDEDRTVLNGLADIFEGENSLGELTAENEEKWITINGNHILLKDGETPQKAFKRFEIKTGINKIINGETEEIVIKDVRNDLINYGESNDIALLKGNAKGGITHIDTEHKEDIDGVVDTILNGKVTNHVKNRKVFLETEDYLVILSLDYFGNKKTWLLTGYKKDEDKSKG